jgi:hypothetical protein
VSFFAFYRRAGRLEQLDHSQNSLLSSSLSGRSPGTIRPLASFLAFYHRGGHLENRTNVEITFMYFTDGSVHKTIADFHVFHKTIVEITFMYFTTLI